MEPSGREMKGCGKYGAEWQRDAGEWQIWSLVAERCRRVANMEPSGRERYFMGSTCSIVFYLVDE